MKKNKLLFTILVLNVFLLFGLVSIISTPAKADEEYWQYREDDCWFVCNNGFCLGREYICDRYGNRWVCYEGWPNIPCGPEIPPPE